MRHFFFLWFHLVTLVAPPLRASGGEAEPAACALLQHGLVLRGPQEQRLQDAQPISWLHFPKAGSSFINAIVHLPGVCPSMSNLTISKDLLGECWLTKWNLNFCQKACEFDKFTCPEHPAYEKHPTITDYSAQHGKLMGMFRDPDQRILSGYHDDANNLAAINYADYLHEDLRIQNCTYMGDDVPKVPILDFAESWKGGMAYQVLTENPSTQTLDPKRSKITLEDAQEAAQRVRDGFAFVGITEEWDLSICLFHKMFGGACHAGDFENTRPSSPGKSASMNYDVTELMGWHDHVDAVVYAAAVQVFEANLDAFDVSHRTCQECYLAANRTSGEVTWHGSTLPG
ncbi:unnamed protein product [Symbiodinium natans]|uniref:Protein kinase domain-containing protein n=1 Tax=Symbiodinium natans TaxID=878477 RepID=A0A812JCU8_9DINO|nr:unnamed protein product [Symbiodinium natans]